MGTSLSLHILQSFLKYHLTRKLFKVAYINEEFNHLTRHIRSEGYMFWPELVAITRPEPQYKRRFRPDDG
jgi:hypothetical protein